MADLCRCVKCKYLTTHDTEYPCNVCEHRVETKDHYEPRTNADHIRSMDDEELADALINLKTICNVCNNVESDCIDGCGDCRGGILEWLKSEVKE